MWQVSKARLPSTGLVVPVLTDSQTLALMPEARDFVTYLVGAGMSPNTLRAYIPRVARFLNWAEGAPDCDWRAMTLKQMGRFKWSLEAPYEIKSGQRVRKGSTVDNILTAVLEFLRFCARTGYISREIVSKFVQPKFLAHMPDSFDTGEAGQYRHALVKELRTRHIPDAPRKLTGTQLQSIRASCGNARDEFLIELLDATGMRIGEALGLRRSDMHFLPESTSLGCHIPGAHLHIMRRWDNVNGVFTKSKAARFVPVGRTVVASYSKYQYARDGALREKDSDYVLVNLWAGKIGEAMSYSNLVKIVSRLGTRASVTNLHPHLFRHTTASRWADNGVDRVVLQQLLGHAVSASTEVYLHPSYERLRAVVDQTALAQKGRRL